MEKADLGAALGFVHVVRGDEHRGAVISEFVEQIPDLLAMDGIEP